MADAKRSPLNRLLFATFLKGRTSSRTLWDAKGEIAPEDNQKIAAENNAILNDETTYPFISYLSGLLAKSNPDEAAVQKLHDCINKIAARTEHDAADVFRALLAKMTDEPEDKQTFDRLLEMAEKCAANG